MSKPAISQADDDSSEDEQADCEDNDISSLMAPTSGASGKLELGPKDQRLMRAIEQVQQQRSRGNQTCDTQSNVSTAEPSVGSQTPSSVSSSSSKRVSEVVQRLRNLNLKSREGDNTAAATGTPNQLEQDSKSDMGQKDKPVNRALLPDFATSAARLANLRFLNLVAYGINFIFFSVAYILF